ncbi:MAG: putative DNA-binding domain-containing protein [Alphaproteobacteria bacterium]|nr:putative DNA-binding domain-containing protein [Alphaproteobacteria bacterium]
MPLVKAKPHLSSQEQLNIYIDGYLLRLCKAVQADYPCLAAYLGQKKMEELVEAYAEATPSRSYNLDFYPFGFWRYLKQGNVSVEVRDLAELEGVIAEIFMLPGSMPLGACDLAVLNPNELDRKVFTLRPAGRLLTFTHDVESYMRSFKQGKTPTTILPNDTYLYVYRHNREVKRRLLDKGEYELLMRIAPGKSLNAAIEASFEAGGGAEEDFMVQVMGWVSQWISEGFFAIEPCNQLARTCE